MSPNVALLAAALVDLVVVIVDIVVVLVLEVAVASPADSSHTALHVAFVGRVERVVVHSTGSSEVALGCSPVDTGPAVPPASEGEVVVVSSSHPAVVAVAPSSASFLPAVDAITHVHRHAFSASLSCLVGNLSLGYHPASPFSLVVGPDTVRGPHGC